MCVCVCVCTLLGERAVFSMNVCHLFPQRMLAITPLVGGVGWCGDQSLPWILSLGGPPLCSVVVTALSGEGSAPELL